MNTAELKNDFPIFSYQPNLTYLDSAATALKPQLVVDKLKEYYEQYPANIHRGLYDIAERATEEYEEAREITARFVGSTDSREIVFTRNTTEALNLLAASLENKIDSGDEIAVYIGEHHSNLLPWQRLARQKRALFTVFDLDTKGNPCDLKGQPLVFSQNLRIFVLTHVSNVIGQVNPLAQIISQLKTTYPDVLAIVDAAQSAASIEINVAALGCDFLAFSGHKTFGPTGVGILYGKHSLLDDLPPFLLGGSMVESVSLNDVRFQNSPERFEAGTPDIASVITLKEALKYIEKIGRYNISEHVESLATLARKKLSQEFGADIKFAGKSDRKHGLVSFEIRDVHPHDIAQVLAEDNIAVRAGYHCAEPLHHHLDLGPTVRASFSIYNDEADIDKLIKGLKKAKKILGG